MPGFSDNAQVPSLLLCIANISHSVTAVNNCKIKVRTNPEEKPDGHKNRRLLLKYRPIPGPTECNK